MFALRKHYILDENQQPIAVQIALGDFQRLEAILEDYGLAQLMDEVPEDGRERLSREAGIADYCSIETAHLLKSPANAAHLAESIEQFKRGNVVAKGLIYEN
jgi:PHD/YefM family antitoxin component YafN of YafNO toxin-antitoxin module